MGLQVHSSLVPGENRSQGRAKQVDVPEGEYCKSGEEGRPFSSKQVIAEGFFRRA